MTGSPAVLTANDAERSAVDRDATRLPGDGVRLRETAPVRRIRVAQVVTGLVLGGGGQMMSAFARSVDRSRFDLDFYCVIEGGTFMKGIEELGFKVTLLPLYDFRRLIAYDVRRIFELAKHLRNGRYDVVHTHLYQADVAGRIAALLAGGPPVVKTLHNMGAWKKRRHLIVDKVLGWRTRRVVCVSEHQRQAVIRQERLDPERALTIHTGVDVTRFDVRVDRAALLRGLGLDPARKTVGTVGRLIPEKGHRHLLDAMPLILERHPDVQFVIVGGGPLLGEMEGRLRDTPYADRVRITGLREDVPALLSVMDVFVFPSLSEGFPFAPSEAMAARCPVACSSLPVLREMIEDRVNGLLFEPGDHHGLAQAVHELLGDEPLRRRLVEHAYAQACGALSEARMMREYERLYVELAGDPHGRPPAATGGE